MTLRDPLTGLRNRRFISEYVIELIESFRLSTMLNLETAVKEAGARSQEKVMGLFLLDIDNFRAMNEHVGHSAGDAFLQEIARELNRITRTDDIVIRWGGEEFLVVLNRTDREFIPLFARKILELFRTKTVEYGKQQSLQGRCSVGCVIFPFCEELPQLLSFEKCIEVCDKAVLHAKKRGRDRAVFPEFNSEYLKNERVIMLLTAFQNSMNLGDEIVNVHEIV